MAGDFTDSMNRQLHLCALMLLAASLRADDWLMYLHDPAHTSDNTAETQLGPDNANQLHALWTLNVGAPLASAPTVSEGKLYFGDWKGNFFSVNASDGSINWQHFVGKAPDPTVQCSQPGVGVTSQPTVLNDMVYVGGGDSAVYAFKKSTGEQVWRLPLADPNAGAYIWSSMALYRGALYVGVASLGDCPLVRGALVRIDPNDPTNPLIRYLVPDDQVGGGIWSTPGFDESTNTVYVTTGTGDQDESTGLWGGTLLALDATTLYVKAHYFLPSNSTGNDIEWGSSPTLFNTADGTPYVAANGKDGVMYALNRTDLSPAWVLKLAIECIAPVLGCGSISTPVFDGTTLYSGAGDSNIEDFPLGTVYAIDPNSGAVLWQQQTAGVVVAPLTLAHGLLYASTTQGLIVFDAATGDRLWDDQQHGALYSQPVVVNGTVYSTYLNGDVIAWQPSASPPGPIDLSGARDRFCQTCSNHGKGR
jgi:outer membrane protein assembly factor BamB